VHTKIPGMKGSAALARALVLLLIVGNLSFVTPAATVAHAAFDGRTAFQIDGNTAGPNDWDDPPVSLLANVDVADACGNGVLDPTTVSGKLEDFDLDSPDPQPGGVVAAADLCEAWYAVDAAPGPDGDYELILYGAWRRDDTNSATSGEVTIFFPLIGPQPGKADDYLITFEYDDSAAGAARVGVQTWNGARWVPDSSIEGTFEAAVDDPAAPTFGEFALDLSATGIATAEDCGTVSLLYVFTRAGQLEANADLQDFVGPVNVQADPCGALRITKETDPAVPIPAETFEVGVARVGGGAVLAPDTTSVSSGLTVPGDESVVIEGLVPGEDYTLGETSLPDGWSLDSITCQAIDPATGLTGTYSVVPGGEQVPVLPGTQPDCTVNNVGPASLTILKVGVGDPAEFEFSAPGLDPQAFTLGNTGIQVFSPLADGEYTVTEVPQDGWDLDAVTCSGGDADTDVAAGTATVRPGPGDRIVCTFVNVQEAPATTLTLVKQAVDPNGTSFPFSVTGPGAPAEVVLTPPDTTVITVPDLTPEEGGSQYSVTELVPAGWTATATTCTVGGAPTVPAPDPGGPAVITLEPGQDAVCVFTNEPLPPPPPASLTVIKQTVPPGAVPDDGSSFGFAITGRSAAAKFGLADGESFTLDPLVSGRYRITELVPDGWSTQIQCSDPDASEVIGSGQVEVVLEPGDAATCTFVNTLLASVTIVKEAVPMGDQTFSFDILSQRDRDLYGQFVLDDDGDPISDPEAGLYPDRVIVEDLQPGTYTAKENVPDGWLLESIECSGFTEYTTDVATGEVSGTVIPGSDASCTYRNVQVGDLAIVKDLAGDGAQYVPLPATYTAEVTCVLPDGGQLGPVSVDIPVTTLDGATAVLADIPVGSQCSVAEPDPMGATGVTIDPDPVVIVGDEEPPATVTVTNTYDVGSAVLTKEVTGTLADLAPDEFTAEVSCEFLGSPIEPPFEVVFGPDDPGVLEGLPVGATCTVEETDDGGAVTVTITPEEFPVTDPAAPVEVNVVNDFPAAGLVIGKELAGDGAQFVPDGTIFVAQVVCDGSPGFDGEVTFSTDQPAIITGQSIGANCTVTEVDTNGAAGVEVSPSPIPPLVDGADPIAVTVTNTFDAAAFTVEKEIAGPGGVFVPPGTEFTVEVSCTYLGSPVAGFSPATYPITVGNPLEVGPLPVGAECAVTETESNGAASFESDPATIVVDADGAGLVTVTNTYLTGSLAIEKTLAGPGADFVPDGIEYPVDVTCTFLGAPLAEYNPASISVTTGAGATLSPLPLGAECTLAETDLMGAQAVDYLPGSTVTIDSEDTPTGVVLANQYGIGDVSFVKELAGPAADFVPDGTSFTLQVQCEFLGQPLPPATITLTTPDDLSGSVTGLPTGAECSAEETEAAGATSVEFLPQAFVVGASDVEVSVEVTNTYEVGTVRISKEITGLLSDAAPPSYTAQVACTFLGEPIDPPFDVTFGPDDPAQLDVPVGAQCQVTETDDGGATTTTIDPESFTVESADSVVEVTITNDFPPAGLQIVKEVTGPGAAWVPEGTIFTAAVTCTADGQLVLDEEIALTTDAPVLFSGLPPGALCTVEEQQTNGAASVEVSPSPIPPLTDSADPLTVTLTNTFEVGDIRIDKVLAGAGAPLVPDATRYTVEVSCTYLGGPVTGFDPFLLELAGPDALSGTVGPLPVGAQCAIAETGTGGATSTSVDPATVTVGPDGPAVATVTNTYDAGTILIEKVIVGSVDLVTGPFVFDVACTFLGTPVDLQPSTVAIALPATSVSVPGLPLGSECSIVELAPYGGADGPATVAPGSVTVGDAGPIVVTARNTFSAPPEPPQPPGLVETGAAGVRPLVWGGVLLISIGGLILLHTRRRPVE
jgi:hypothetical protein